MALIDGEECFGCGWAFEDYQGGETCRVPVWNKDTCTQDHRRVCVPCYHASHSGRYLRSLDNTRMFIAQCTNLVLAALDAKGDRDAEDDT